MKPLFVLFWQLCRFQKGPQDVPYSPVLLVVLLMADLCLGLAALWGLENRFLAEQALGMVVAIAAWTAMLWGLLRFKGLGARFVQVMIACVGTDLLMSLLILPMQVYLAAVPPEAEVGVPLRLALLVVLVWDILIKARIYGAALGLERLQANLLSISIWLLVYLLSYSFLPPEAFEAIPQQSTVAPN